MNRTTRIVWCLAAVLLLAFSTGAAQVASLEVTAPPVALTDIGFTVEVTARDSDGNILRTFDAPVSVTGAVVADRSGNPDTSVIRFTRGTLTLSNVLMSESGEGSLTIRSAGVSATSTLHVIPGILSILPPLLAIILALIVRQVVISLFAGIWLGAFFLFDYDVIGSVFRVLDHFVVKALSDVSHLQIILFSLMFGGMVGVISKNGGTVGIANVITRYAKSSRGGQLAAWGMAFILFFDDYANCLVRGNLMRPITDKLRISREKLSFIVDAGAATVASVMIISTWIGYEVGLIDQGLKAIGSTEDAYAVFLQTIPYRFYPIFTLILVFLVAWMRRDFGPMYAAELRAYETGKVIRDGAEPATDLTESTDAFTSDVPARWFNGILPILAILIVGLLGLWKTGTEALIAEGRTAYGIGDIISSSDSYAALMWASFSGVIVAIVLTVGQRLMSLTKSIDAWFHGIKSMLLAMIILVLAWSIGTVTEELHTANYLVEVLRGTISPHLLPVLVFLIAAVVSFSTGTSWGTMAIMMPLVIPLGSSLSIDAGLAPDEVMIVLHGVISSVLAGAVFGDHCSPISDTTILSSMASACDHIDHVRTQLPYAMLAAVIGMLVGDIPTAYGMSPWISIVVGVGLMIAFLRIFGKQVGVTPTTT